MASAGVPALFYENVVSRSDCCCIRYGWRPAMVSKLVSNNDDSCYDQRHGNGGRDDRLSTPTP